MPDTAILLSIEAAGKCARYDAAAKRILSFKAACRFRIRPYTRTRATGTEG